MVILLNICLVIFAIVSLLMILVILMQRPKSEGLGAAFGGGVTENIFGAQTTNVLTKITGWLAGIFFLLTFLLSVLYAQRPNSGSGLRKELMKTEPAAAVPATTPGAANAQSSPAVVAPAQGNAPAADTSSAQGGASPTGADMAVGAVQPIPSPAAVPLEPDAPASPAPSP